jgi:hypothetical protein
MKHIMKKFIFGTILLLAAQSNAELRIWTGRDGGQSIEAEYLRFAGDQLFLKRVDGKELKVSLNKLSEEDIQYVQLKNPPKLEIDGDLEELEPEYDSSVIWVDERNRRHKKITINKYLCEITLKQCDKNNYDLPLICRVYWFASRLRPLEERKAEGNRWPLEVVVLTQQEWEFKLSDLEPKKREWSQISDEAKFKFHAEIVSNLKIVPEPPMGWDIISSNHYYGYLIVILDQQNNVLEFDTDQPDLNDIIPTILSSKAGEQLLKIGLRD